MGSEVIIRKFESKDRLPVREIACATALRGEPCTVFFDGQDVFADALSLYYTDYEPASCFVAEGAGRVIGYLLGAKNTAVMARIMRQKIIFPLAGKAVTSGILFRGKNIRFFLRLLLSFIKGEFREPCFGRTHPATLHINIADGNRARGIGTRLIAAYLDYLKREGVPAVHFATYSDQASCFFKKQGFQLLYQTQRSYFQHVLHKNINLYIYGKILS